MFFLVAYCHCHKCRLAHARIRVYIKRSLFFTVNIVVNHIQRVLSAKKYINLTIFKIFMIYIFVVLFYIRYSFINIFYKCCLDILHKFFFIYYFICNTAVFLLNLFYLMCYLIVFCYFIFNFISKIYNIFFIYALVFNIPYNGYYILVIIITF